MRIVYSSEPEAPALKTETFPQLRIFPNTGNIYFYRNSSDGCCVFSRHSELFGNKVNSTLGSEPYYGTISLTSTPN